MLRRIEYRSLPSLPSLPSGEPANDSGAAWPLLDDALTEAVSQETVLPEAAIQEDPDDSAPTIAVMKCERPAPVVAPTEVVAATMGPPLSPRSGPSAAVLLSLVVCVMGLLGLHGLQERLSLQRTHAQVALALAQGSAEALLRARERVQAALKDQPQDPALLAARARLLGALLVECGGIGEPGPDGQDPLPDEAAAAALVVRAQTSADALAAQGYLALWRGDAEVVAGVVAALRGDAREPGLSDYFAGLLALYRGDAAAAVADLDLSIQMEGPRPLRQVWRARALRALGQSDEARAALEGALRQQPDQPAALVELAWLNALAAVPEKRLSAAQELRALEKSHLGLGRGPRAAAYVALAEVALLPPPLSYAAARQALGRARALRSAGDPVLLSRLAAVSLRASDPGAAIEDARAALLLWPARDETRLLLVRGLLQRGQAREALDELDREGRPLSAAVTGRAPDEERLLLRAEVLLALGSQGPARALLGELLAVVPNGKAAVAARLLLLRSLLQKGDLLAAQRVVRQIMAERPEGEQRVQARLLLARLGLLQRPPLQDEALGLLESVVAEAPELVEARQQLGRLLSQLGRPAEAAVQLREALRLERAAAGPEAEDAWPADQPSSE